MDAKGRVSIPADFRRVLDACDADRDAGTNPRVTICYGDDRVPYFTCYSMKELEEIGNRIEMLDEGSPDREALEEHFYTLAVTLSIDDAGRLLLSLPLRQRIGVTDQLTFAGRGTSFRIHSPEAPVAATSRLRAVLDELPEGTPITARLPKKRPAAE
ncbi:cell division protein MraZ [Jannaschia seosinensis]|uniref:Transcriptional regulator MraZ n=1 Tax=Jannaschia seosinensis TaxID=313367 RepID=A0A0M7B536_9RHOB|nr:division/cell wall cluster transcriptional repressor MraZ [Jannaschia seosinensis]CUH19645.1 cell division protein MraZ [Jannaschia seosinensis]